MDNMSIVGNTNAGGKGSPFIGIIDTLALSGVVSRLLPAFSSLNLSRSYSCIFLAFLDLRSFFSASALFP